MKLETKILIVLEGCEDKFCTGMDFAETGQLVQVGGGDEIVELDRRLHAYAADDSVTFED